MVIKNVGTACPGRGGTKAEYCITIVEWLKGH